MSPTKAPNRLGMFHDYVTLERARSQYRYTSMLDRYIGECMISIFNINNGITKPTCGYQDYNII